MVRTAQTELNHFSIGLTQTHDIRTDLIRKLNLNEAIVLDEKLPRKIRECPKTIYHSSLPFRHIDSKI